jgi:hypothetical protein
VKETVITAPKSNAVNNILSMNGVSLAGDGNSRRTGKEQETVVMKKKMVVPTVT